MTTMSTKTYMAKPGEVEQKWWLVDGSGKVVGRLASQLAMVLMGKHRPTYTPHIDTGDFVVVLTSKRSSSPARSGSKRNTPGTPATRACGRKRPANGWPASRK